jgi:hypothetical protein
MSGIEEQSAVARLQFSLERHQGAAHRALVDVERAAHDETHLFKLIADGARVADRGPQCGHVDIGVLADDERERTRLDGRGQSEERERGEERRYGEAQHHAASRGLEVGLRWRRG